MKVFYVIHYDIEDPEWTDLEFAATTREACEQWIKDNWRDYAEDPDEECEDVDESDRDADSPEVDNAPEYISEFYEDDIKEKLHLGINDINVKDA